MVFKVIESYRFEVEETFTSNEISLSALLLSLLKLLLLMVSFDILGEDSS